MEPIVQNSGTFALPPRSISVISAQAPTELDTKHLYQLDATDLTSGIIPLVMDHEIDHKYLKLLKIPLLSREHLVVHIPKTVIDNLQPIEVEDFEVSNMSWTTDGTPDTTNSPVELPCMPP